MSIQTVKDIAKVCHEVNRAYCVAHDDLSHVSWDLSPEWQRVSCIAGVQAHLMNRDLTPADSHRLWLKTKEKDGWVHGEVKDAEAKTHPCIMSYDDLPPDQKLKDCLFAAVVGALAPEVVDPLEDEKPQSKGKYRVGVDFNPSGNPTVNYIKLCAAELVDVIEAISLPPMVLGPGTSDAGGEVSHTGMTYTDEVARLKALAQTAIEEGAMWAVKAATKQEP